MEMERKPGKEINGSRPGWFQDFFGTAITYYQYTNQEEFLETALGAGRLIDQGKIGEAKELVDQAKAAIIQARATGLSGLGEVGSHQVVPMINSGQYPRDLSRTAEQVVAGKYPEKKVLFSHS